MTDQNRTPAGVPTGGQFAASAKAEPDVALREDAGWYDADDRDWREELAETLTGLGDGGRHTVVGPYWKEATITCRRTSALDGSGQPVRGATRGSYAVAVEDRDPYVVEYDNLRGDEAAAVEATIATVTRLLAIHDHANRLDPDAPSINRPGWDRDGEWEVRGYLLRTGDDPGRYEVRSLRRGCFHTDDLDEAVRTVEADGFGSVIDFTQTTRPRAIGFDERFVTP